MISGPFLVVSWRPPSLLNHRPGISERAVFRAAFATLEAVPEPARSVAAGPFDDLGRTCRRTAETITSVAVVGRRELAACLWPVTPAAYDDIALDVLCREWNAEHGIAAQGAGR